MSPELFETLFTTIGRGFSPEVYLATTKVQGILWSAADIALIYFLLKIAGLARIADGRRKVARRYRLLALSAVLIPFLVFMPTARHFFILESIIFGLQFSILIHTLAADTRPVLALLAKRSAYQGPEKQGGNYGNRS